MATMEQDLRLKLLNTLLTTPHRDLGAIYPVHQEILAQDPRFYVQLAAWYADEGEVRDHKEMFVINLSVSAFPGHRDVGLALLSQMPPYQVGRVVDFIKGKVVTRLYRFLFCRRPDPPGHGSKGRPHRDFRGDLPVRAGSAF